MLYVADTSIAGGDKPREIEVGEFSFSSHTQEGRIYCVIEFKEETERRSHKSWVWDPLSQHYRQDEDRECSFSILIESDDAKFADIWLWRSYMSDPAGIAEDMFAFPKADGTLSPALDDGGPCWESVYYEGFVGQKLPRFKLQKASGSYADVSATAIWKDGKWRVTLSRPLSTGNKDDIVFRQGTEYRISMARGLPGKIPEPAFKFRMGKIQGDDAGAIPLPSAKSHSVGEK